MIGPLSLALSLAMAAGDGGTLAVTPEKSVIAYPLTARLTARLGPGERAEFPEKPRLPEGAEALGVKNGLFIEGIDGSGSQSIEYLFMAYKLGRAEFPAVEYGVRKPDGQVERRVSPPAYYEIVSARTDPAKASEPVDIRPPLILPVDWKRYIAPALALLAALIAGALIWRKLSAKRLAQAISLPPPMIPPHVAALESLGKLRNEDLFAKGEGRAHFFLLSEILRRYVEGRYGVPALERTTDEFETVFDLRFERKDKRDSLISLLRSCDEVKFANREATVEDGGRALALAVEWVERTKPAETRLEAK